MLTVIYLFI